MKHFVIAGYGYIGKVHAAVAPAHASFLVRHLPEQTDGYRFFTEFETAAETSPLFMDICTPNSAHEALTLQALEKGLPVYCEKPLSGTLESAQKMAKAARTAGLPAAVAFNYRFLPCVQLLKELTESRKIGNILYYTACFLHDSYILPRPKSWRTEPEAGGGALADLGIHLFDLCRYIFGDCAVSACEKHIFFPQRTQVDEYARCTLAHEHFKGYLEISRVSAGKEAQNGIEVFGDKGSARICFSAPREITVFTIADKQTKLLRADDCLCAALNYPNAKEDIGMFYGSHKASLTAFTRQILNGQAHPASASFEDGLNAQMLLKQALDL